MVKLVDTKDLKSFGLEVHAGSTPAPGTKPGRPAPANRTAWLVVAAAILWLACAAAFVLPGQTLDWGRDLLVFFGQINALEHGQVPYRDFRTSMGALPFYLPWLGYRLVGGYAGALELGGLLATALLLPCVVVALRARFGLPTALALLSCLTAMAAAPFEHGFQLPSHVGFYNRWCAAALTALFLFAAPPRQRASSSVATVEGAAIAALLLFLFFTKATYFAVGFAFTVGFGAILGMFRPAALIGAAGFALVVGAVHGATGVIDDYLAELVHSSDVSALSWYTRDRFLQVNLPRSLGYYGVLAIASAFAAYGRARLGWPHWAFVAYAFLASLAIQGHDAGFCGPFALIAPLALLGEHAVQAWRRWHLGLLALFMLPFLAALPRATFEHEDDASPVELPGMAGVQAIDVSDGSTEPNRVKHFLLFVAEELASGLHLLRQNGVTHGVLGLDYYNYFPPLLATAPLPGRLAVLMPGRTLDRDTAPAPAAVFAHTAHVLVPETINSDRRFLLSLYSEHLRLSYRLVDRNEHWQLWERKP